ncbi:SUKH-3 domain-containing protein [Marinactinospora rubrisoli]|uniref:SUKH-3 domain-containing protein n=1 Tax=Marinactinospora rubrisoli TaxID=2715399 RepID=A0ABW2KMZ2_9ACTN
MSEGRSGRGWSARTEARLRAAGWYPGRRVDVGPWVAWLRERGGFVPHPAARAFLREFGGLASPYAGPGRNMARSEFRFDPAVAEYDDEIFSCFSRGVSGRLYPLGGTDRGNRYLAMDEAGAVFSLMDSNTVLGRTAEEALDNLCEGVHRYPVWWD